MLGDPYETPFRLIFSSYPFGSAINGTLQDVLTATAEHVHDSRNTQGKWPFFGSEFSACSGRSQVISAFFPAPRESESYDTLATLETDDVYTTFFWDVDSWASDESYFGQQRNEQIGKDTLLVIAVFIACFVLITAQTRSIFVAQLGLVAILLATGFAFCLYRIVVSPWFGVLNAFSVFLLLGIACDDIFVLSDAWRQAVEVMGIATNDYETRLRFMMRRGFPAITATSLTTAGAFFGNAISNIPPLRLFGVFSGFMVLADWVLSVLLIPPVLVLQNRWFEQLDCGLKKPGLPTNSPRLLERLLTQRFAPCVFKIAPFLVVLFAVITSIAFNLTMEIKPGAEFHESELFPYDHVQRRGYRAMTMMANLEPEYVYAGIIYGVVPEDEGDMNNPASSTEATWDNSFDLYAPGVQEFTEELCTDLLAQRGMVRRLDECWAQAVKRTLMSMGQPFPATNISSLDEALRRSDWRGVNWAPPDRSWVRISFQTTLLSKASVAEIRAMYDRFEAFMQKWNAEAERRGISSLTRGFQTSHKWRFMSTIENLATTCISSCCISTLVVFVLLLFTMRNLVVVAMVVLHVISICLTLIACFVLEGRSLGVIESISATLLVGLSVDYLVHVGSAYLDEPEDVPRERRALNAIGHIGGSVIAGSATTVVSAISLCFGTISFFVAFGRFVIGIICLSLIFTLLSLASTLYLFGPENNFGSLRCRQRAAESTCATDNHDANNALTGRVVLAKASRPVKIVTATSAIAILVVGAAIRLWLSLSEGGEEIPACPALIELDFTFDEYAIPQAQDSYRCRDFDKIPSGCTYYVTEWEPIITNGLTGVVHHMILFATDTSKSTCPYTCFDMPNALGTDAAWAVGGGQVKFPDGVSYPIGGHTNTLQIHYNNAMLQNSLVDVRSGIKLKLTSTPPTNASLTSMIVGLHPLGNLWIEPGRENTTLFVDCAPRLLGPVTVLAYSTHAHKLGFSVLTEIRRETQSPGGAFKVDTVGDVGSDPSYRFDLQQIKMFPAGQERHLEPGDIIRVICSFRSTSRMAGTSSGWGSDDEMCMTILYAYPRENVGTANCLSDHSFEV
eukprot:TRINITY_DN20048_c0_g1_i1.p1 TRINITY_DN20048_c0_g1~~TRINITY_DN20048_c0_g1_i1.p1  ORF type:complete len:1231 (+),score=141.58 TRINITY_DN20048_c0_g1_i1:471-3695(+)